MASYAIYLTIVISVSSVTGFKLNPSNDKLSPYQNSNFEVQPFVRRVQNVNDGPIAGYPKAPPPNAHESGGQPGDLLPPLDDGYSSHAKSFMSRRSIDNAKVDPKTGYPLLADPSWKFAGGNEENLQLPLENSQQPSHDETVDPKTGYPLKAKPSWKDAGGDESILQLPLENVFGLNQQFDSNSFLRTGAISTPQPVPLDDLNVNTKIDPRTGYPLVAEEGWRYAGGTGDILEVPLEETAPVSQSKVDPKTGYPLLAESSWKDAGGNGDILQPPVDDSNNAPKVDPKTGYPLLAEDGWKEAGGTGDILDPPIEDSTGKGQVDPKTGYPLVAESSWQDAGGNGDILELPIEDAGADKAVDPKTGYPLVAQPGWKDAGGNEEILGLPFENTGNESESDEKERVDPKTGYPLKAQPGWAEAGGNGDILQLPLDDSNKNVKVDSKTGYPLEADPKWELAGGDGTILQAPISETPNEKLVINEEKVLDEAELSLSELKPPAEGSPYSTGFRDSDSSTVSPFHGTTFFTNDFQSDVVNPTISTNTFIDSAIIPTFSTNDFLDNTFHTTNPSVELLGGAFHPGVQQHSQIISLESNPLLTSFLNLNAGNKVIPTPVSSLSQNPLHQGRLIQSTHHGNSNHVFVRSSVPVHIIHPKGPARLTAGADNLPAPTSYQVTNIYRKH